MTPEEFHEFFAAAAGVAGALVGLLFVAVSVTMERMSEQGETQIHRVRAATALTAFSNALAVSLFALIPGVNLGYAALAVGVLGALFVIGALLSMVRLGLRRPGELRSALFLVGLIVVLVFQLRSGTTLIRHHHNHNAFQAISILVVSCFVIGISRSWELIGGPAIGLTHELFVFGRAHRGGGASPGGGEGDPTGDGRQVAAGAGESGNRSGSGSGSGGDSEPNPRMGERPQGEGGGAAGSAERPPPT
ncbi:MAG: hypothetical protein WAL22_09970 [Solirubrobacteraceae bacterium]